MPTLTMIAGPNGSGKSSITASRYFEPGPNLIDPDAIAKALNPANPTLAALAAGRQAILSARSFVERRESFAVETTLAGNGQLALLGEAKRAGFEVKVFYIATENADVQVERVRLRLSLGGHDVPEDDIRRRYERSLANAPKALQIADSGVVLDNSGLKPAEILQLKNGAIVWEHPGPHPAWIQDLKRALSI
jgi:predicted ABC-type ATPase